MNPNDSLTRFGRYPRAAASQRNASSRLAVLAAVFLTAMCTEVSARNYAMVVAVRDYPNCGSLPPLAGVDRDAVRLQKVLQTNGFEAQNIEVVCDEATDSTHKPTRQNILGRLDSLLARTGSQDLVLVVTTSHGLVFDNASYLCPSDTTEQALAGGSAARRGLIAVKDITDRMSRCRAANKLLVVDACRDASRSRTRGFVELLESPPEGLWLMSSCSEEQYSYVSEGLADGEPHAVFTYFLCEGLGGAADMIANNDGQVSLLELYGYAYAKTVEEVRTMGETQTPELFGGLAEPFAVAQNIRTADRRLRSSDPILVRRQSAESLAQRGNEIVRAAEQRFIAAYKQYSQRVARGYRESDEPLYQDYHRHICYALGNYLTPALDFDPDCKDAHLARGWCYRASGRYGDALEAFRKADEPLDLYIKGNPDSLDQYIERRSNGSAVLAAREENQVRPSTDVTPLLAKPAAGSASVSNVSPFSRVRVGEVEGENWLLVTAVDDNPLPQSGWLHRDQVVWFAEATEVYTPASPMLSQLGQGGGTMALSRLEYASQNLHSLADQLEAPINEVENVVGQLQSIPFVGGYIPSIPYLGYARMPSQYVRTAANYASLPSSYVRAATGWAGVAQNYQYGLERAQRVQQRRDQLLMAKNLELVTEKPLVVDTSLWRDASLVAAADVNVEE